MKQIFGNKFFKIVKWIFFIILGFYILLVIGRTFYFLSQDRTEAQVAKIHATKLTMDDVMGKFLPPNPGSEAGKTLEGVDVNGNGIRDDVELAIFEKYPKSPKTRAALLQYALVLQMGATQEKMSEDIATAISQKDSKAYDCIGEIVTVSGGDLEEIKKFRDFIISIQLNTKIRQETQKNLDKKTRSFELQSGCDIDLDSLKK